MRTCAPAICLVCAAAACGQTFEVASIRPARTAGPPSLRMFPGGRTVATNATLRYLITFAYNIRDYQISGGPGWVDSAQYDIEAKPAVAFQPSYNTRQYAMKLIQSLLEDRFQLKTGRTSTDLALYVLSVAKNSSGLKARERPQAPSDMKLSGGKGLIIGQAVPMAIVSEGLASVLGRPVRDRTGLPGYYDFRLEWSPDDGDTDGTGPSIFTAIQEQLGLKLEARRGFVDVLVIENASQPSEN